MTEKTAPLDKQAFDSGAFRDTVWNICGCKFDFQVLNPQFPEVDLVFIISQSLKLQKADHSHSQVMDVIYLKARGTLLPRECSRTSVNVTFIELKRFSKLFSFLFSGIQSCLRVKKNKKKKNKQTWALHLVPTCVLSGWPTLSTGVNNIEDALQSQPCLDHM